RLLMGLATFDGPHLIIMDEPTNNLDIDSRAALIDAINEYDGAIILMSHDRHMLEACADRLWLVGDGAVKPFDGDMDDYHRFILDAGARERKAQQLANQAAAQLVRSEPAADARPGLKSRRATAPLRKKLDAAA